MSAKYTEIDFINIKKRKTQADPEGPACVEGSHDDGKLLVLEVELVGK